MANKGYGYQYETSPRKIEPEYRSRPIPKKKKVQTKKTVKNTKKSYKKKTKKVLKLSFEVKFFINSMLLFAIIFAIIACQALVNQRYKEKESLKKRYNEMASNASAGTDLTDEVRKLALDYGMQTKSATLINLDTSDYIELSENEINTDKDNCFQKIMNWIKNIF